MTVDPNTETVYNQLVANEKGLMMLYALFYQATLPDNQKHLFTKVFTDMQDRRVTAVRKYVKGVQVN